MWRFERLRAKGDISSVNPIAPSLASGAKQSRASRLRGWAGLGDEAGRVSLIRDLLSGSLRGARDDGMGNSDAT